MRGIVWRTFSLGGALLALVLATAPPAHAINSRDEYLCYHGEENDAANLERAIAACTRAIKSPPKHRSTLTILLANRGWNYLILKNYDAAISDYTQAIRYYPKWPEAYVGRGVAYFRKGDYPAAVSDFSEALNLKPHDLETLLNRAAAYFRQGDYALSMADFDEAIQLKPNDASLLNSRCWARAVWGQQLDLALADCDAALRITPKPVIFDSRGLVHFKRGEFEAALVDYNVAVNADAGLISSLYMRGVTRLRLGQTPEGEADIAAAIAKDPNIAETFARRGVTP